MILRNDFVGRIVYRQSQRTVIFSPHFFFFIIHVPYYHLAFINKIMIVTINRYNYDNNTSVSYSRTCPAHPSAPTTRPPTPPHTKEPWRQVQIASYGQFCRGNGELSIIRSTSPILTTYFTDR